MSLFGYLEQDKADLDRGFAGDPKYAPWNIAAEHFKVEVKDLLFVESNSIQFHPGYDEEAFEEWEEFNEEIRTGGIILKTLKSTFSDIQLIGIGDARYLVFRESGFVAYYTT